MRARLAPLALQTWVPWFFMLSGFVLTQARLKSDRAETIVSFLRKRTAVIYPLYAVGLASALTVRWSQGVRFPASYELMAQGILAQSLVPWLPERSVQVQCWFLSAMVPFWLLFAPLFSHLILRLHSLHTTCAVLALLTIPPWLSYIIPLWLGDPNWYMLHHTGQTGDALDLIVITLKFNPACYLHVFVYGMVLARLRGLVEAEVATGASTPSVAARVLARCFRFCTLFGYASLLCIFTIRDLQPASYKLSARLSLLMPFQGMILIGLSPISTGTQTSSERTSVEAEDQPARTFDTALSQLCARGTSLLELLTRDPIVWLFSFAPRAWGNVSYSQYVLQFIAMQLWPQKHMQPFDLLLFFGFLLSGAWLMATFLVGPIGNWWHRQPPFKLLFYAFTVSALLGASCVIDHAARMQSNSANLDACGLEAALPFPAPQVVIEEGAAIDIRLNWTSEFDERVRINPSILWWGATLVRAARAHRKSCLTSVGTYRNQTVLNVTTIWESDIVLSHSTWSRSRQSPSDAEVSALRGWNVSDWDLGDEELTRLNMTIGGHPWGIPCAASPSYYPQNATLHSTIVTGPEDPKIMQFSSGSPQLVFSSLPSRSYDASCGANFHLMGGFTGRPVYQMYLSQELFSQPSTSMLLASPPTSPMMQVSPPQPPQPPAPLAPARARQRPPPPTSPSPPASPPPPSPPPPNPIRSTTDAALGAVASVHLDCGTAFKPEKNWIAFTSDEDDRKYFVQRVAPHTVVVQQSDGSCAADRWLTDDFTPFMELEQSHGISVHGSATAVRWRPGENLAVVHTKDGAGRYVSMLYTFSSRPPFAVLAVSRPLPLQGGSASFPSGLALPPNSGKIVVTYGVADMQGRALVMSTNYVSTLFNWCMPDLARALANRRTVPSEPPALYGHASTREQRGRWSLTWLLILLASVPIPCAYYIGAVAAGVQRPRVELKLGEVLKSKPSKPSLTALPAFPFRMSTNVIRKDLKPAELKPKVPKHKRTRKIPRKGRHKFEILPADEDADDGLRVHEDYELDHAKAEEQEEIVTI